MVDRGEEQCWREATDTGEEREERSRDEGEQREGWKKEDLLRLQGRAA